MRRISLVGAGLMFVLAQPVLATVQHADTERDRAERLMLEGKTDAGLDILKRLSTQGDVRSQAWYGGYLARSGLFTEAERWLLMAAKTDDAEAQYALGKLYLGLSPSRELDALYWLHASSAQGYQRAALMLEQLASRPTLSPPDKNNQLQTTEITDANYAVFKQTLLKVSGGLACYGLTVDTYAPVFEESDAACKADMVGEYGGSIPAEGLAQLSQAYGMCLRGRVMAKQGITAEQLVKCSRDLK